jgi:hypothetical protein
VKTLESIERQLERVAQRLHDEFGGAYSRELVREEVRRAHARSQAARVHLYDAVFAYRFAREALRARSRQASPVGG